MSVDTNTTKVEVDKHMKFHIKQKAIQLWAMWKCKYTEIDFSPLYKNFYYGKPYTSPCVKSKIQYLGNFWQRG